MLPTISNNRRRNSSSLSCGQPKIIRFRTHFTNTIFDVFKDRGYKQTDSELDWDIHWADVGWIREVFDHIHLEDYQKVNQKVRWSPSA